jgi:hypothetical protein
VKWVDQEVVMDIRIITSRYLMISAVVDKVIEKVEERRQYRRAAWFRDFPG